MIQIKYEGNLQILKTLLVIKLAKNKGVQPEFQDLLSQQCTIFTVGDRYK